MAGDRTRNFENLPPLTREASDGLSRVLRAAETLMAAPPPTGRGAGGEIIEREVGEFRDRIRQLTKGAEGLDQQLCSPYRLLVVGPSQVGKSTLINVLAGERVLATTGVGDAKTLKETVLTYSSEGHGTLFVQYISRQEAQRRRFTLESYARKQPELHGAFVKPWNTKETTAAGVEDDAPDLSAEPTNDETTATRRELDRRYGTLVQQIKTLIYPEVREPERLATLPEKDRESLESATVADWVDGWCLLLGHDTVAGGRFHSLWHPRLASAGELLGGTFKCCESEGKRPFLDAVERHTAEGLAFLVDRVELALPSEDLELMDVEDLPGVGNYQDPAADVARDVLAKAMRERDLDGLLVVAAQNGLDQNTANLVEEAAVLRRVLQGETDLAVAITHVDQIARQLAQEMEDQGVEEDKFPSNDEILRMASKQAAAPQVQRLKDLLQRQVSDLDKPERDALVAAVLERTRIVGVEASAAEAHRFNMKQKKEGAFAKTYEGTGVSELMAHFKTHARARHEARLDRVVAQTTRIRDAISADLNRIARDHDAAEAVRLAVAARETYVGALQASQHPLSNRWTIIREQAASQLEYRIPAQFPKTSEKAQKAARKRKNGVINRCENAGPSGGLIHWATMKAALRWGGTWSGAHHLDLPGDLAEALMPALLSGWRVVAQEIEGLLSDYRTKAEALLDSLSDAVANAAREAGLEPNAAAITDARAQLQANIDAAITVLDARVDQLTELVQPRLRAKLKGHFERECERVLREINMGTGFTQRALRRYNEVGETAIEKGTAAGVAVLEEQFSDLRRQIKEELFGPDPVAFAYRRLVSGVHDTAEAPEIVEARAALVEWAHSHIVWESASTDRA
ncbi:hypothetical protein CCR95_22535 [Thiocystis minor]|uniref:hypothetical protein n=1 Tax=Thiocystis minor TaxID=61597 RepID=UPI001914D5A6|nr:hypothetical protein [Thiocystis minor]MBK5966777.1 hypothetical protein [Thiocystis minor]